MHVLPLHVANKIAAGEVVERPASVVKELVENAIDAGSTQIKIAVAGGGRKSIAVQDNGCGMEKDDALLALERQATSKILDVPDIENISTLGFRGEAIPSIASVSRFAMTTRTRNSDEGTFVQVDAGRVAEVRSAGCPPGTLVEVRDLFCNVPARQKFLRSPATEESHIRQIVTANALAHPEIGFALSVDGREVCNFPPCANCADRILAVYSGEMAEALVPVAGESGGIRISGFVERPNPGIPVRRDQYIFVNGRPASAPVINATLRDAYPRQSGESRHAAFIFIELSPREVDVNVHPTKREVRFRSNSAVRQALSGALAAAFAPAVRFDPMPPAPADAEAEPPAQAWTAATAAPDLLPIASPRPVQEELPLADANPETAAPWNRFRFLAVTDAGYVLVETESGIVTVNPKAARERIAFEQLKYRPASSQELLIPETVKLSPAEFARIDAALPELSAIGWQLEAFGDNTFKVEAVPTIAKGMPAAAALATIASDLGDHSQHRAGEKWRNDAIARSLSRSLAGFSAKLDDQLATRLVEALAACRMPYVSPAGKPVLIFTSNRELARKFAIQ